MATIAHAEPMGPGDRLGWLAVQKPSDGKAAY